MLTEEIHDFVYRAMGFVPLPILLLLEQSMMKRLVYLVVVFSIGVIGCSADVGLPYKVDYAHSLHENNYITVKNFPGYNENFEIMLKDVAFDSQIEVVLDSVCRDYVWFDENVHNVMVYRPSAYDSSLLAVYNAKMHKIEFFDSGLYPKKYNNLTKVEGWCQKE